MDNGQQCFLSKQGRTWKWNLVRHFWIRILWSSANSSSECISECRDEFNDIVLHEKRSWILSEHLFVNELFEEYIKHIRKLSTKEFNSHCKQAEPGFWYHHWLPKIRSFCWSIHKLYKINKHKFSFKKLPFLKTTFKLFLSSLL